MLQPNLKEMSLVNRRIIHDYLRARNLTPETFEANEDLRKAVRQARTKQRQDVEAKKKELQRDETKKARDKLEKDIKKTRSMKEDLRKLCSSLEKDFEDMITKAANEKKSSHTLAVEAVSLKRTRDEKLKEIEKLDAIIENLAKRKKDL